MSDDLRLRHWDDPRHFPAADQELRFVGVWTCGRYMYKAQRLVWQWGPFYWWQTEYLTSTPNEDRIVEAWWTL